MKLLAVVLAIVTMGACSLALAQGGPSGRGSTTGDPAASSANPSAAPQGTSGQSSRSGSGTSTSGGKDENGDQGRDKMPEAGGGAVQPREPERK
jgi:hypothetical protein